MANSKFAIYLRATGTLRVSPDVGLRRWIAGTSPGQGRIEFVAAAWILYGDWGKGDVWSSASVVKRLSGTGFAKTNTKLSTTNAKMEGAHTEMARE